MPEVVYDVDGGHLERIKARKLSKQNKFLQTMWNFLGSKFWLLLQ